jgi:type I restriction enzyme R subunit
MARELTEMVRWLPKLDWTQRESVRATLRRNVRRLLARYGYPPDLAEGATALVLRQAELSTEARGADCRVTACANPPEQKKDVVPRTPNPTYGM